jgi:hypothetical protein
MTKTERRTERRTEREESLHLQYQRGGVREREGDSERARIASQQNGRNAETRPRVCPGGWVDVSDVPGARDTSEYCVYCTYLHRVWYCTYLGIAHTWVLHILQYCAF